MKIKTLFFLSLFFVTSCNENGPLTSEDEKNSSSASKCFEASYVTGICGQAVLKIENSNFFDLGEDWGEHKNVFYTILDCSVDETKLETGTFFVKILEDQSGLDFNCVTCLAALDYNGTKKYSIEIVANCDE